MLNKQTHTKTKPKHKTNLQLQELLIYNTPQNSSDNFPSYPPDNPHSSDDVYWRGGECQGHLAHEISMSG